MGLGCLRSTGRRTKVYQRVLALAAGIWHSWQLWETGNIDVPGRHFKRKSDAQPLERDGGPRGAREDRLGYQSRVIEHRDVPDVIEHDEVRSWDQLTHM